MKLFSACDLGGIALRNRLVRSATGEGAAELHSGRPTPEMAAFYGRLAEGGVGLVVSGHVAVSPEGRCNSRMTACTSDEDIPAFRRLVSASHTQGVPLVCQLNHGGRQVTASPAAPGIRSLCPSGAAFPGARFQPEVLDGDEIVRIIADFAAAARRCREAGFDGIQLHSAHGYLISQFNSPLTNRRTDEWGGSAAKRRRFLLAVYAAVRREVGADYPVWVKQNVADFHPDGLSFADALAICEALEQAGISAIELSGGIAETVPRAFHADELKRAGELVFFEKECREIRQRLSCSLILTGGIRTAATAERLLGDGLCDAIGLCRPLIREPDLPRRWQQGQSDRAACISCGACRQSPEHCNTCALVESAGGFSG